MPASLPNSFYALETTTGLLEQQVEFVAAWIQLHKVMIDNCPGCPGPPVDGLSSTLTAMTEALRIVSEAVSRIAAQEALASAQATAR